MTPTVSVIIPAYNHEQFVGQAIESVLQQSWEDLELLVIDDGSTDRTGEVAQGYSDSRLHYFYQENQDAFNTLNRGLQLARGAFISILNSDDVYTTNRLERLIAEQKRYRAQCLFTDVIPIDEAGGVWKDPDFGWNQWHRKNREFYFSQNDLYTGFLHGNFMVTTSNLFLTREAVSRTGGFCSLRYLHDYDYIFRVMLACPEQVVYLHDEQLLMYRIHSGNTLGEAAITGREQDKEVIRKYLLQGIAPECRQRAAAGADRLAELERELCEVRAALSPVPQPGVRDQARALAGAIVNRFIKR